MSAFTALIKVVNSQKKPGTQASIFTLNLLSVIRTKNEYTKTKSIIFSDIHNNDISGCYDSLSIINFRSPLDPYKKISSQP